MAILTNASTLPVGGARIFWDNQIVTVDSLVASSVELVRYTTTLPHRKAKAPDYLIMETDGRACNSIVMLLEYDDDEIQIGEDEWELSSAGGDVNVLIEAALKKKIILSTFDERPSGDLEHIVDDAPYLKYHYVMVTKYLEMAAPIFGGHAPAALNISTEYQSRATNSGQFIGRNKTMQEEVTRFSFSHLPAEWYRTEFMPFVEHAKDKPFFIQWRPDKYSQEISYGTIKGDVKPTNQTHDLMSVSFDFVGWVK